MAPLDPQRLAFLIDFVRRHTGNEHDASKDYLYESRLAPVAAAAQCASVGDLAERLRRGPSEALVQDVIDAMTTHETSFFRDRHPFETLATDVLPAILDARRASKRLSLWSAAASSGQEAYSLVILLKERFPELADWRIQVVGTDISEGALNQARTGAYSHVAMGRGLTRSQVLRHFRKDGERWRVCDDLRRRVTFQQLDLRRPLDALPTMDVVFMRYVLIYFDPDDKRQILERVVRRLRPGGALFLGATEMVQGLPGGLERVQIGRTRFYRGAMAEAA